MKVRVLAEVVEMPMVEEDRVPETPVFVKLNTVPDVAVAFRVELALN